VIRIEGLAFAYAGSPFRLRVPALTLAPGACVALTGPSGTGKTTLLKLIAGILRPSAGGIRIGDAEISRLGDAARRDFRSRRIGFVFQDFGLIDYLTVHDNIVHPYRVAALRLTPAVHTAARAMADELGLADLARRFPAALSQGERQRVAICRALLTEPALILADEPTGNLDADNKRLIVDQLTAQARRTGATLLTVTHDSSVLDAFDQVIDVAQWQDEAR